MGQGSAKFLDIPPSMAITLLDQPHLHASPVTPTIFASPKPLSPPPGTANTSSNPLGQVDYECHELTAAVQRLLVIPVPKEAQIAPKQVTATDSTTLKKSALSGPAAAHSTTTAQNKSQPLFKYNHYGKLIGGNHLGEEFRRVTPVVAIDCEMVGVGDDCKSVLARISVVNKHGFCLYDTFVKPRLPVTEYRTDKSGVRELDLIHAPPHDLVVLEVATMLSGKVVVGHSVHNDFEVIELDHPSHNIRDTATYYRALHETTRFPGLKSLSKDLLKWKIQEGEHSSIVDAQASMALYLRVEVEWEASLKPTRNGHPRTTSWTPPGVGNWKMMTIFPRGPELFLDTEFVRPIQVDRPYNLDDEYLDTQFRLLREDFMKPLREGIQQFKKWQQSRDKKKQSPSQVRIYENVRFQGRCGETKGLQRITIPVIQKTRDLSSTSEDSKFLINGSLLLFSPNGVELFNRNNIKLAIVIRINEEDDERLRQGSLNVNFVPDGPTWKIDPQNTYTVLESVAFFEAYRFSLENLQVGKMNDWKLAKYIRNPTIPFQSIVLSSSQVLDFSKQLETGKVLLPDFQPQYPGFPTATQLGLSKSQYQAYHSALTKEVAIIQGPPGTGKTFIAMKVIKFFLCNPELLNDQPIVIVSNTNHSLDHLLEMVIKYAREMKGCDIAGDKLVLRFGGQSKSELVSGVTLHTKRRGYDMKVSADQQLTSTREKLRAIHVLSSAKFENYKDFVLARPKLVAAKTFIRVYPPLPLSKLETKEDEAERNLETSIHNLITELIDGIVAPTGVGKAKQLKENWTVLITVLPSLVEIVQKTEKVQAKAYAAVKHHIPEGEFLRSARILGMTVTGSAKHKARFIERLKPIMVVVEEAAHVLEATVVSGLTRHCKRLLLIGDHKQLRPSTADYELTKANHLDVSMMERFVRNAERVGIKTWTQLDTQRRMRPEISRLITPTIYAELHDDPVVLKYPNVKGMEKNLFFLDHGEFEEKAEDSTSFTNPKEADFLINLCLYLIGQGNVPAKITIITTYLGQKLELEKRMRQTPYFKKIRICCVDGFQGEENDIILLSLVRSNDKRSIGFLTTNNRVCVALSRARHGMYIVGNMSGLAAGSRTWAQIQQTLISGNSIGRKLRLKCSFHGGLTSVDIQNAHRAFLQVHNGMTRKCFCETPTSGIWTPSTPPKKDGRVAEKGNGGTVGDSPKSQNGAGGVKIKPKQGYFLDVPASQCKKELKPLIPPLISVTAIRGIDTAKKHQVPGGTQGKNDKKNGGCDRKLGCGHPCDKAGCKRDHTNYKCQRKCERACNGGHKCPGTHVCYITCPKLKTCFREVSTNCPACGEKMVGLCCVLFPYEGKRSPSYGEIKKPLCTKCQPKDKVKKK